MPIETRGAPDEGNMNNWTWGEVETKPRLLHTMVRVKDFAAALRFYIDGIGMKVLDRFDVESRRVSAIFIGFEDYEAGGVVELVYRWDVEEPYTHGTGYGHFAIGVPDIFSAVAKLEGMGSEITLRPTRLKALGPHVAFVKDPDGYDVELIQTNRN